MNRQLKLVYARDPEQQAHHHTTTPPPHHHHVLAAGSAGSVVPVAAQDVMRVWVHWRELLRHGRPVARQPDAARWRAVAEPLGEWGFDVEVLLLAVEGCAGSAWCRGANRAGRPFDDISWIMASSERIERLAAEGERSRAWVQGQAQIKALAPAAGPRVDPTPEQLQRLAALREALNRRAGVR